MLRITLVATLALLIPLASGAERKKETDGGLEGTAAEQAEQVLGKGAEDADALTFPTYDERRDVFYSLEQLLMAEKRRAELEAEDRAGDPTLAGPSTGPAKAPVETDNVRQAETYAKQAVSEVEAFVRSESWERAMSTAERHLNRLRPMLEQFSDSEPLARAQTMLQQYYVLAENKKFYEEARAQFEALGLRVEGIIWSADQPSLAIIKDEPVARGINDRVKGTVIKNIDQNRVDFMYSYRQRRFHFQLYLEPKN